MEWTKEEDKFLKDNYFNMTMIEMATKLNKSLNSINDRRKYWNLTKINPNNKKLTKEYLLENYVKLQKSISEIAEELGIKKDHIKSIRRKFKIPNNKPRSVSGKEHKQWNGCGELSGRYLSSIKYGAESRNLEFNITLEFLWNLYLKQDKKCKISGRLLCFGKNQTASIDRIDPQQGYIESNVRWVHKEINNMKKDFTDTEFIRLCRLVVNNE